MTKFIKSALLAILLATAPAWAQTYEGGALEIPIGGQLRSSYVPGGGADTKMVLVDDLDGAIVKSITNAGVATVQLADNTESTVALAIGGGGGGLTTAQVQSVVGAMFSSNTETGITLTYQSSDETIDAVVLVDTDEIENGAVTLDKLAQAVQDMFLESVTTDSTLDGQGTTGDELGIADEGVGTDQLADDAVTQAKLANNRAGSFTPPRSGPTLLTLRRLHSDAVGTNELEDDAVTNAKLADDSVHNVQLASNSVRADEIQANAVGTSELVDDVTERLCPDPSGGTSGQVCATNGTVYELVTQSAAVAVERMTRPPPRFQSPQLVSRGT